MNKKYFETLLGIAILATAFFIVFFLIKPSFFPKKQQPVIASIHKTENLLTNSKKRIPHDQTDSGYVTFDSGIVVSTLEKPPQKPFLSSMLKTETVNGTLQICDSQGNFLIGTQSEPVFDMKVSPSEKLAVLTRGDGVNQIYSLSPFSLIMELPRVPKMPRATAFDKWQWLDENKLVGVVEILKNPALLNGLTGAERESPEATTERTLLFTYDLKTNQTMQIDTRGSGLPLFFIVSEIHQGGYVEANWVENDKEHDLWISLRNKAP